MLDDLPGIERVIDIARAAAGEVFAQAAAVGVVEVGDDRRALHVLHPHQAIEPVPDVLMFAVGGQVAVQVVGQGRAGGLGVFIEARGAARVQLIRAVRVTSRKVRRFMRKTEKASSREHEQEGDTFVFSSLFCLSRGGGFR